MFDHDRLRLIPGGLSANNLKEVIEQRCTLQPQDIAINFLHDGELDSQQAHTYGELDRGAKAILGALHLHATKGERALLLFPAGNFFLLSFVACLYGGIVAVPVAFPGRRNLDWERVFSIVRDCGAKVILSCGDHLKKVESRFTQDFHDWKVSFIDVSEIPAANGAGVVTADIDGDALAFLQYTSGSTGAPKGVMVSHANLLHNQRVLQTGFKNNFDTRYVSWLPLFHDMGLIGCALQSLYLGVTFNYMAPAAFLQRPLRWLRAISHFRATTSGAPNFAYELCAARYSSDECHGVDLSAWQCAFNGAEPVRPDTIAFFQRVYSSHGLAPTAQFPCYGLAEGVLMVSGATQFAVPKIIEIDHANYLNGRITPRDAASASHSLVGVGSVVGDQELAVVDPASYRRAPVGTIGEIWVHGKSVARGYWNKPDATHATFKARIEGDLDGKCYLRTGDSGYIDASGELYITGRIKDTLIIHGKNYFPQDIEYVVETSHESLKEGGGAVFSIERDGQERVIVVQEVRRTYQKSIDGAAVIKAIRQRAASQCELNVFDVCLLKPGTLLKTTSGKVQRQQNKKAYLSGDLNLIARHQPFPVEPACSPAVNAAPAVFSEDMLLCAVQDWIKTHRAMAHGPLASDLFIDAGLTSVDVVALAEQLSALTGQRIEATMFWDYPEIGDFCRALAAQLQEEVRQPQAAADEPVRVDVRNLDDAAFQSLLEKELST